MTDTQHALQVTNNGTAKVYVMGRGAIGLGMVPTSMFAIAEGGLLYYADNSSAINAGGLSPGDFYYSGADPYTVCVVITPP
jgi:hypothetical protein